jgi:hypothetical protein
MSTPSLAPPDHPQGEHAEVDPGREDAPVAALTFGGRVHVEWDPQAPVTPLGQLPFFIEYLRLGGLFDPWVADCPLAYTSPNAPKVRDVLGTVLLAVLAGHRRYAHITGLRADGVNPGLLGMGKVVSEDAVRRALARIDEAAGLAWLARHLDDCVGPLPSEPWILDVDTTIKPLFGHQEGAEVSYNPHKPGRPSHVDHTHMIGELRLALAVEVQPGRQHHSSHAAPAPVGAARAPRPRALAGAAARRHRLGERGAHEPGRAGGAALPVQAAHHAQGPAPAGAGDGRGRLGGGRPGLRGQGGRAAAVRLEPGAAGGAAAPAPGARARDRRA